MHLRDRAQFRQRLRLFALGARVDDDEVGAVGEQAVLQRQRELRVLVRGLDARRRGHPGAGRVLDSRRRQGGTRGQRRAAARGHELQRDLARRLRIEPRKDVDRLAAEQALRGRRDPLRRLRPRDVGALDARRAQPREHAQDRGLGVLVRRDELAGAAGRVGQAAQHALGRRAADADHEDALLRAARLGDQRIGAPDLAVGDQQHVGGTLGAAQREHRPQRGFHLGAAEIGLRPRDALRGLADRRRIGRDQRVDLVHDVAAEAREAEAVGRSQPREDAVQRALGGLDAVAGHRAGAVDDELQAQRQLLRGLRHVGAEARQRDVAVAVLRHRGQRLRGQAGGGQHEVAVQPRGAGERHGDAVLGAGRRDRMRRRRDRAGGDRAAQLERQRERILDREIGDRRLVRLQAALRGIAVARRDDGRHGEAHAAVLEAQQLRVPVADRRFLARHQVAEVDRAEAVAGALQHDRRVALVDRVLVLLLGRLALDHHAGQQLVAERHVEIEQHRAGRQRKRVDRLDVGRRRIAVALLDRRARRGGRRRCPWR